MNCKFCNGELPEDVTLCPECGRENLEEVTEVIAEEMTADPSGECAEEVTEEADEEVTEEADEEAAEEQTEEMDVPASEPKQKPKVWMVILAVIGAIALVGVLIGAVAFGVKSAGKKVKSYTVSDDAGLKVKDVVVATVGDVELTNSELQIYYWQAVNEFYEYYGYYMDLTTLGLDLEKPLDEQFYNEEAGLTWQQYFLDSALSTWSRYAALSMQAKEENFALDAETLAYIESIPEQLEELAVSYGYENIAQLLEEDMGAACDETGYMIFMNLNLYAGQYMDSKYALMAPTMEEIEEYYAQNEETLTAQGIVNDGSITTDVRHILVCPQGGTEDEEGTVTYSEEEWEECRVKAQQILDQWQAEGGTEELFAQMAMEYTEDPGSMSTGGLYTDIYEGQMVAPFEEWCFDESRQYGDTGLVQTTYGYHVMFFVEAHEVWITNVTDTIVNERSLELVNAAVEKWPMEADYKKIVLCELATAEE